MLAPKPVRRPNPHARHIDGRAPIGLLPCETFGVLTFGLRVHHGYVGILFLVVAWLCRARATRFAALLVVWGSALVLSDAIHHFLVLWPIEGSPEFHFWYGDPVNH